MDKLIKLVVAGLAAIIVLSLAVGSAGARLRLEINTTAFLASGRLSFSNESGTQACDVTLHITASRLINKIHRELIGHVTAVLTANPTIFTTCTPLVPMLLVYLSISGTLPNPTGLTVLVIGGFLLTNPIGRCLYEGSIPGRSTTNPVRTLEVRSAVGDVRLARTLGGECAAEGRMTGTMSATPEVTIRLLER